MAQKKSKRTNAKYPALNKSLNTKFRRHYIEPDYINGVYDENGAQVIRPLNEEEIEWLNKFYSEVIVTSFNNDDDDFYSESCDKRVLYNDNNRRRRDVFNIMQATGKLKYLNGTEYDKHYSDQVSNIDFDLLNVINLEKKIKYCNNERMKKKRFRKK